MSTIRETTETPHGAGAQGAHHDHPSFLAHHFETPKQQFETGKLGMWVFLAQEILFFSGLFVAYSVYRANHPEVFIYAHQFLDSRLGAINTVVLILSSFTIAWAVRCAQLNNKRGTVVLLLVTFVLATTFLGIKAVEYNHKWKDGLLWGTNYHPEVEHVLENTQHHAETPGKLLGSEASLSSPKNVHIFFGIYFAMTGLHALHVIVGMGIILWMIKRAARGEFSAQYFGPVEYTGLYWHLVDLVWIYLFPMLYLIS